MPRGRRECLQRDACAIESATEALVIAVMARRPHPEQVSCTHVGILWLIKRAGGDAGVRSAKRCVTSNSALKPFRPGSGNLAALSEIHRTAR